MQHQRMIVTVDIIRDTGFKHDLLNA